MLLTGATLVFAMGLTLVVFLSIGWGMSLRLADGDARRGVNRWLLSWALRGLFVPILVWAAMNIPWTTTFQPFIPKIQLAKNNGSWLVAFLQVCAAGTFAVATYWCALTLGWAIYQKLRNLDTENYTQFRALCWTSLLGMLLPAILVVWVGHWMGLGLAVSLMFLPIAGYAPSLLRKQELPPMYARAIARIKFGKYSEAEWEIIKELEKHQNDFDGWLMLAELYAIRFGDVNEAEQTILEICDQPKVTPSQMSVALHKLADWHLNLQNNPEAARRALQVICLRLPGSHLARMAKVRAESLPISSEELKEQKEHRPVHLPALSDSLIEGEEAHEPERPVEEAAAEANRLSERLKQNPNDTALRERLARILAGNLDQAGVAIDELELLLQMPDQLPAKRAEWLGLMAIWELHHRKNRDASRLILERIVKEFPSGPHAMAASRRLRQMAAEDVMQSQPPPPKIGKIEI